MHNVNDSLYSEAPVKRLTRNKARRIL